MAAMRLFLAGVSCVGKTTVGKELATLLGCPFFDLDNEIERFFGKPLERLQSECLTMHTYRKKASQVLKHVLARDSSRRCVVALPPSGLMGGYPAIIKAAKGVVAVLTDTPENILARTTFFDVDSRPVHKVLSEEERRYYLKEIKEDMAYFGRSYRRADLTVDISGLGPAASAAKVRDMAMQRQG